MKDRYLRSGNGVPEAIVKEYNRMISHERYVEALDRKYGLIHKNFDKLLEFNPDPESLTETKAEAEALRRHKARLESIPIVLDRLMQDSEQDYQIIYHFYLADHRLTLSQIADKYGITKEAVRYRLKMLKEKLKDLIIFYEDLE